MHDMSPYFTLTDEELRRLRRRPSLFARLARCHHVAPTVQRPAIVLPSSTVAASRPTMIPEGLER